MYICNGNLTSNPADIVQEFSTHLVTLYSAPTLVSQDAYDKFLYSLQITTLMDEHKTSLDASITTEEIQKVIKFHKSNKRPGPDGFSATY